MLDDKDILENENKVGEDINEDELIEEENEGLKEEEQAKEENLAGLEGINEGIQGGLDETELGSQIKDSFLDYAMSVIVSRALPDARDGFKPVHRRIIYGMVKMKLYPSVPHKKSARITGDVMGKYHPHGDSAIYSALARMAQPFAMRYPLVDGHGNFGNQDGDEPAAARYTEARLSKISLEMVKDITKETVSYSPTYDGDSEEPDVLPSRFPNLLVNGSSGIAVGMATNIPPHNLAETISAVQAIIKNPDITVLELMNDYIKGPDFPCGGVIMGRSGIRSYFETGNGSVKVRGKYHVETKNDKASIIFTELPYMVNKKQLAKKIIELAENKTLEGIAAVNDYSSYKIGTKFVIELKKGVNTDIVINHLFRFTPLQSSFAVNLLALDKGAPRVLNLKQALSIYANFQKEIITKRTIHDKKTANDRLHIIEGMLIVKDNTDEVVKIIRSSENDTEASKKLSERFKIDNIQTDAILAMPLRRLTKLDGVKFVEERDGLLANIARFDSILNDPKVLESVLIDELEEIKKKYGDERRSIISDQDVIEEDEALIEDKEVLVVLTKDGYVKRMPSDTFRVQNRGGKGVIGMQTKEDDEVDLLTHSRTKTDILFFTSLGKVYKLRGYMIPEASRTSKGIPIINMLRLDKDRDEKVLSIISLDDYDDSHYLFFVTKDGIVKKCKSTDFANINVAGKIAITLKDDDELKDVKLTDGNCLISLATKAGKICTFHESDVRFMGRTAAGVRGMKTDGSEVISISTSLEGDKIFAISSLGKGKMTPLADYRITGRGGKGVVTMNIKSSDEEEEEINVVGTKAVFGDENILVITDQGTVIKLSLKTVATTGRNAKGVNIIKLKEGESISSISVQPLMDEEEETEEETVTLNESEEENTSSSSEEI